MSEYFCETRSFWPESKKDFLQSLAGGFCQVYVRAAPVGCAPGAHEEAGPDGIVDQLRDARLRCLERPAK
jgi:hypothetical protein